MDAYQKFSFLDSIEMNNPQLKNGKGKQAKAYQKIKQELSAQPNKKINLLILRRDVREKRDSNS